MQNYKRTLTFLKKTPVMLRHGGLLTGSCDKKCPMSGSETLKKGQKILPRNFLVLYLDSKFGFNFDFVINYDPP